MERRLVFISLLLILCRLCAHSPLVSVVLGTVYQVRDDWQTVSWRFIWGDNSPQRLCYAMLSYHRYSCSHGHYFYTRRSRYVRGGEGGVNEATPSSWENEQSMSSWDVIFFFLEYLCRYTYGFRRQVFFNFSASGAGLQFFRSSLKSAHG